MACPHPSGGKNLFFSKSGAIGQKCPHPPPQSDHENEEKPEEEDEFSKLLSRHKNGPKFSSKIRTSMAISDEMLENIRAAVDQKKYSESKAKEIRKNLRDKATKAVTSFLLGEFESSQSYFDVYKEYVTALNACNATGIKIDTEFPRVVPDREIYKSCLKNGSYTDDDTIYVYIDDSSMGQLYEKTAGFKNLVTLTAYPTDAQTELIRSKLSDRGRDVYMKIMNISEFCVLKEFSKI